MKNQRKLMTGILCILICFIASCSETSEINPVNPVIISGIEARNIYESNENVILLDVRSPEEFEAFHLEDSILIPAGELESRIDELPYKEDIIIVYCKAGIRSEKAVEILSFYGYINVYDMQSIDNWFSDIERDLMNEIDRLTNLVDELIENSLPLIPDEDLVIPEGLLFCGRCSGCGLDHFMPDPDYEHNYYHDHSDHTDCGCNYDCHCHMPPDLCPCGDNEYTPCDSCENRDNCSGGDCDNCPNQDDCERNYNEPGG